LAAQPNHGIYGAPDDKFAAGYAGSAVDDGPKAVTPRYEPAQANRCLYPVFLSTDRDGHPISTIV
jgi:hypothetical protein